MNKKFTVKSSNKNEKGGFVTKITSEVEVKTPFSMKTKKETYYVSGTDQLEVGSAIDVDMDMFRVQEYPFEQPDTGETIMLKWLHLK